jgi:CheY-like chemotaxis protein
MGHEVCSIEFTEDDAVAAALCSLPDLIISDVWLRDGTGISAIERILRIKAVGHLFITGDIAGLRLQMPDSVIVQKPFNEIDLALGIERALAVKIAA